MNANYIEIKKQKLKNTYNNYLKISSLNLKDKYKDFEQTKLDASKTLLYEILEKPKYFNRYSRGQIVRVKFGVNIGSEFSGEHFAIVISKQDTSMNPILHVIPLTSKKHLKSLNVGYVLYSEKEYNALKNKLKQEKNELKIKQIKHILNYYGKRKNRISYACIEHIKTISKLSVNDKMFNEYDYLNKLRCDVKTLKIIDNEIIKEYTVDKYEKIC